MTAAADLDVLVIGAGQAGLAMGYHLARAGRDFLIVDAADEVGQSWRRRWDSLRLFTPARYSALPGLPFPAAPDHLPGKDEVADYIDAYARRFDLPVQLGAAVRLLQLADGRFEAQTERGAYLARSVVVATGPFQQPAIPAIAARMAPEVTQLHTADYRSPDQLPPGPVLVVGSGNSGVQIAEELSGSRPVSLAAGRRQAEVPQRLLGRDLFSWLDLVGIMKVSADSRLGRRIRDHDPLIGTSLRQLRDLGVQVHDRVTGAGHHQLQTADGHQFEAASVIWATGYRPDYGWLTIPEAIGDDGWPRRTAGASPVPGLHHLGLTFLRTRGSALLGWVGHDAEYLTDRLAERAR